jgi:guanylate kinase
MKGKAIIISAPSGAGKTTIVQHLIDQGLDLEFSISACSRPPRPHEVDEKDYYFFSEEKFKQLIDKDAFLEWEEVYPGQFYGTLKEEIDRVWRLEKTVIFDVDVEGGLNIKKYFGKKALAIFIMPPDTETLRERLTSRGTETEEKIDLRMAKAQREIDMAREFDAVILNKNLSNALEDTELIVREFLGIEEV